VVTVVFVLHEEIAAIETRIRVFLEKKGIVFIRPLHELCIFRKQIGLCRHKWTVYSVNNATRWTMHQIGIQRKNWDCELPLHVRDIDSCSCSSGYCRSSNSTPLVAYKTHKLCIQTRSIIRAWLGKTSTKAGR